MEPAVAPANGSGEAPPLAGLRVVEFGQYIAIPAAGQLMCDLGADVIKVEAASGDPSRTTGWGKDEFGPMFVAHNRGKRSVVLNLGSEEGRTLAFELAMSADVVLQNARPGAMARAGLDPDRLRAANPRLIVATVTGFGRQSAYAGRVGLDIAAQGESGMMSINGPADREPNRVGFPLVDIMTAQHVSSAVLAALVRRGVNGLGARIDLALADVATVAMTGTWAEYGLQERLPMRSGNGQLMAAPAADVVATADGAVVVSAYVDAHFVRLADALGQSELARDSRFQTNASRVAHRPALLAALAAAFARYRTQELCELLGQAGVVIAAVRNFDQVRQAPNGLTPDLFVPLSTPTVAAFEIPGPALRINGQPAAPTSLPAIGEHTQEVLAELAAARQFKPVGR